jgi:3-hexulose-6-phosphate synthase
VNDANRDLVWLLSENMKLQLSLDMVDLDEAFDFIEATKASVDIIEVGTPFALKCGLNAI